MEDEQLQQQASGPNLKALMTNQFTEQVSESNFLLSSSLSSTKDIKGGIAAS
jgi:hypothetical protein